jgi:hypothetical protein
VQHLDRLVPELGDPDMDIGAKNWRHLFSGVFPMFVPSLSWQNDRFYIYKWLKNGVFRRQAHASPRRAAAAHTWSENRLFCAILYPKYHQFTKTGSGQT